MTTARYVALFLMACAEKKKGVDMYDNSVQGPGCGVVCVCVWCVCDSFHVSYLTDFFVSSPNILC